MNTLSGMLDWLYIRVCMDHICTWHVANCVKEVGESFVEENDVTN